MFRWICLTALVLAVADAQSCGGVLTVDGSNGVVIQSPNYPNQYQDNALCTWTITSPAGTGLTFIAEAFATEAGYDKVTITDITGTTSVAVADVSGSRWPDRVRTQGNVVRVVFRSDSSAVFTGFSIRVTSYVPKCSVGDSECPYASGVEETCFSAEKLCDGNVDCPGGRDENCPTGCGTPVNAPILRSPTGERIVGGVDARQHSWPWQISMLIKGRHNCGGSIIDHQWVVTAAHCCTGGPAQYKVRVGEHDIGSGNSEVNAWTYDVERVVSHPRYNRDGPRSNDICLLKTKLPIFFNEHVFPVCLPTGDNTPVGTDCYTTGWGSRRQVLARNGEKETRVADNLQQVDVKLVEQSACRTAYANLPRPAPISADMLCGYNPGKDSCQGDSGGPFVCPSQSNSTVWELVGVVSWGYGCASPGIPGVYARTSVFLDWIAATTRS